MRVKHLHEFHHESASLNNNLAALGSAKQPYPGKAMALEHTRIDVYLSQAGAGWTSVPDP
jgi:hypothetical protein